MPRFAGKLVKVFGNIGLLTVVAFVIYHVVGRDVCGQATKGYHTFRPQTQVQLAG